MTVFWLDSHTDFKYDGWVAPMATSFSRQAPPLPWYVRVLPISWCSEAGAGWLSLPYWGNTQVCTNPLSLNPAEAVPMAQVEDEPRHAVAGRWSAGSVQQDPEACQGVQGRVSTDTDTQNVRTDCSKFPGCLWSRWEFAWVRYTLKWDRSVRVWPVRTRVSIENASLLKS